jgi:hypothetical protein
MCPQFPRLGLRSSTPQEFQGVRIFRMPMKRFDAGLGVTVYSFEYLVENLRDIEQMLSVRWSGAGFDITPANGTTVTYDDGAAETRGKHEDHKRTATRLLPPRFSGVFALVTPLHGEQRPGTCECPWRVLECTCMPTLVLTFAVGSLGWWVA